LARLITAVREGTPAKILIRNAKKDGTVFLNSLTLHPIRDSSGVYRYNVAVLADGSENSHDADELRMLRDILPSTVDAKLQPMAPAPYGLVSAREQWNLVQPNTAKMIRLLWATDPHGALGRILNLHPVLRQPTISSIGAFIASPTMKERLPNEDKLLQMIVVVRELEQQRDSIGRIAMPFEVIDALCQMHMQLSARDISLIIAQNEARLVMPILKLSFIMPSHKSCKIKIKLGRNMKSNRPMPNWVRLKTGNTIRYNTKRGHWRRTKNGF